MHAVLLALLIAGTAAPSLAIAAAVETPAPSTPSPAKDAVANPKERDEIDAIIAELSSAANASPQALKAFPLTSVRQLLGVINADPARLAQRPALLEALYLGGWNPGPSKPDGFWMTLIRQRLEEGRIAEAAQIAHSVDAPSLMVIMRIEKRYDPITSQDERFFDPIAGGERQLAAVENYRAAHPESLNAVNLTAILLMQLGRNGAALVLLDQAIEDAHPPGSAASRFSDLTEFNWTLEYRAVALKQLGRLDEADAQWRDAAKRSERGRDNVSQKLNAAEQANWAGRPKDALKLIGGVGEVSGYGKTVKEANLVCAYAQLNDERRMLAALKNLTAHSSAGPANLLHAQLCAGDLDGASATVKRHVADPKTRSNFLTRLQTYRPAGDTVRADPAAASDLPFENVWLERRKQVLARPDVAAAIDAEGRVETFPIFNFY